MRALTHKSAYTVILCALLLGSALPAHAIPTDSAFSSLPDRFQTEELTLGSRALGDLCYSRDVMPDGTVCNPAYLADLQEDSLLVRAFVGNGYTALTTADQFIFKPISRDFLRTLFQKQSVTSVEANVGITFTTRNFFASFQPYRVQYFSELHNPNLPVVAVHAAIERAFVFGGGVSLTGIDEKLKDFRAGAKLRILERDFVHGSFSFFDVLAEEPRTLLPARKQTAIFLEPTIAWISSEIAWKPRASVTVIHLGSVSNQDALFPQKTDVTLGFGAEPTLGPGRLRLSSDFVNLLHAKTLASRIRLGAGYQYGILEGLTGWNDDRFTLGIQFAFQVLNVGVSYEFDRKTFEAAEAGQRISTEFSIRI